MVPEDVVNNALDVIGHPIRISGFWDGSYEALVARDLYMEVRDEVLAAQPWQFARHFYTLVTDPGTLGPGWTHRWVRPANAITILSVYQTTIDVYQPYPTTWLEVDYGERLIFTRFAAAQAAVTDRVSDVNRWPPEFTSVVIQGLAQRFAALFGGANAAPGNREQRTGRDRAPAQDR